MAKFLLLVAERERYGDKLYLRVKDTLLIQCHGESKY